MQFYSFQWLLLVFKRYSIEPRLTYRNAVGSNSMMRSWYSNALSHSLLSKQTYAWARYSLIFL